MILIFFSPLQSKASFTFEFITICEYFQIDRFLIKHWAHISKTNKKKNLKLESDKTRRCLFCVQCKNSSTGRFYIEAIFWSCPYKESESTPPNKIKLKLSKKKNHMARLNIKDKSNILILSIFRLSNLKFSSKTIISSGSPQHKGGTQTVHLFLESHTEAGWWLCWWTWRPWWWRWGGWWWRSWWWWWRWEKPGELSASIELWQKM